MANSLLTIQAITNEALSVLENELTFTEEYKLHMKEKGRWQILRWEKNSEGVSKYKVHADNLTYKEAEALKKIY